MTLTYEVDLDRVNMKESCCQEKANSFKS